MDLVGPLFKTIKDGLMSYFPPDMSPQQKAELELRVGSLLHQKEVEMAKISNEAVESLNRRIKEQEGTAKDLLALPVLGRLVLFLRGLQRPAWGFATMYMDNKWFFGDGEFTERQQLAMIIVNTLVLGFLFGERAVKNLEPLIIKVFAK